MVSFWIISQINSIIYSPGQEQTFHYTDLIMKYSGIVLWCDFSQLVLDFIGYC